MIKLGLAWIDKYMIYLFVFCRLQGVTVKIYSKSFNALGVCILTGCTRMHDSVVSGLSVFILLFLVIFGHDTLPINVRRVKKAEKQYTWVYLPPSMRHIMTAPALNQ